ncbi:hypothetical protein ACT3RP_09145 [Halomonas sp. AOP5-B2-8]
MAYGISSRDYLERARNCLSQQKNEFLFYAAFEIRCGVEARMQEYLEVQAHISKKKRQGWQVAKLARNIENVFRTGEQEAVLLVLDRESHAVKFEARYTPVKRSLREKAEKLGNYLHAGKKYHEDDGAFWLQFRTLLDEAVAELEHANSGRLLGPLLLHPNRETVDIKLELPTEEDREAVKILAEGDQSIFEVTYE